MGNGLRDSRRRAVPVLWHRRPVHWSDCRRGCWSIRRRQTNGGGWPGRLGKFTRKYWRHAGQTHHRAGDDYDLPRNSAVAILIRKARIRNGIWKLGNREKNDRARPPGAPFSWLRGFRISVFVVAYPRMADDRW